MHQRSRFNYLTPTLTDINAIQNMHLKIPTEIIILLGWSFHIKSLLKEQIGLLHYYEKPFIAKIQEGFIKNPSKIILFSMMSTTELQDHP